MFDYKLVDIVGDDEIKYTVKVKTETVLVKMGTFSPLAEDPEEYGGTYKVIAEVCGAFKPNLDDDENPHWLDQHEVPLDVIHEAEAICGDY